MAEDLFAGLVGQTPATALLRAALVQGRLAPAYLFSGPDGVGRSLAARRFLEGVIAGPEGSMAVRRRLEEGNHPDLLWVEPTYSDKGQLVPASQAVEAGVSRRAPPQLRLEQVRGVSQFLGRRPLEASRCLVVIEAVEAMAEGAANALLKTLEEPGDGLLVLLSAAPDRLLSTIRSRCQQVPFARLQPELLQRVLAGLPPHAAQAPGLEPAPATGPEPPELRELAAGSPGALLRHRQQWQALPAGLAERLSGLTASPVEALALARDLSEALDGEQQLWLLDWWQLRLWRRHHIPAQQHRLETLRRQLRAYVQPRLAWEVALLELSGAVSAG
ncbi:DNA polymerase III subunit delta' [Vulcanococcus limneticus Candia 3F8]|uniref:DNA polymerase III subunit delta' n=1 Tax=Vulcanococcus limneticus TaxID=2170428 RepID=UPI000B98CF55|nr:DNA polymerase III subunit delta' [Vulcanococcus limneticus]MCP9792968.1 DNA polymerase III subunit delta' [Vulcanococcus limneticus MW73D5]MCP9895005.1 DNA polymerase III subunit delta' [Vulcanococcus limneticus Candia 3F8]MCP9898393.1 DNA polymerase III subunit delta' [Vulcanococcus limneticus Candia 3B3]